MRTLLSYLLATIAALTFSVMAVANNNAGALKDDKKNPLRIFAIYHDDLPKDKKAGLYAEYIEPFTREFETITGRKIHVIFDQNRSPYSNFNYKGDEKKIIEEWNNLAWEYRRTRHEKNEFVFSDHDRVLLITNDMINGNSLLGGIGGYAVRSAAIASLATRQVIGHELGHTFNAVHEHGEVLYNGWWCETFMFPPLPFRSSCLVFSETNRKRIKDYVDSLY